MVKSNEFNGASLADAVKQATAAYRRVDSYEAKSYCSDIRNRFDRKKLEADQIFDRIVDMQREVDRLENEARRAQLDVAIAALIALAGALGSAARAVQKLRRLQLDKFTKGELLNLLPVIGGALTAAARAGDAASALKAARRLSQEIDRLYARVDRLGDELIGLAESYVASNCHLGNLTS